MVDSRVVGQIFMSRAHVEEQPDGGDLAVWQLLARYTEIIIVIIIITITTKIDCGEYRLWNGIDIIDGSTGR